MGSQIYSSFVLLILFSLICSSQAYKFYVGGKDGWVLKPSEDYNHWARKNRFQVNDTLIFKYNKGSDSVLLVSKEDYNNCNKEKPRRILNDGVSKLKFHRSGPFYFISGHADNCEKGQKIIIRVLAARDPHPKSPSPVAKSPSESPTIYNPTGFDAPAPAPSGAPSFGGSVGLSMVLGFALLLWGFSF